jgi:hypothetical protein
MGYNIGVHFIIPDDRNVIQEKQGFVRCLLPGNNLNDPERFTLSVTRRFYQVPDFTVQPVHGAVSLINQHSISNQKVFNMPGEGIKIPVLPVGFKDVIPL